MARCTATPPCAFPNEVHEAGCPSRGGGFHSPELAHLYRTESPVERETIGAVLEVLVDRHADQLGETPDEYDGDDVTGGEPEWLALRSAVRRGLLVGQTADLFTLRHEDDAPALHLVAPRRHAVAGIGYCACGVAVEDTTRHVIEATASDAVRAAVHAAQRPAGPRYAALVVRDPDGGTDVTVYVDGKPVDVDLFEVDAGRGYDLDDWQESTDSDAASAAEHGPDLVAAVLAARNDPPGAGHIDGWYEARRAAEHPAGRYAVTWHTGNTAPTVTVVDLPAGWGTHDARRAVIEATGERPARPLVVFSVTPQP